MIDEMMIFKDGFGFPDISRKVLSDVQIDVKVITGEWWMRLDESGPC